MIRMPVTVKEMGHVMNVLPFKTVGDIFRSIKQQVGTREENTWPIT
jgi:hypothetical protein